MARGSAIPPESFDEILAWLDPDRDVAASMYLQLHEDLTQLFQWRSCADPEGLADEVFNRVAKKVHEVRPSYEGNPRLYFHAVAKNVIKENLRTVKNHVSLTDFDGLDQPAMASREDDADIHDCLDECLQKLGSDERKLILEYYERERQEKIDHRSELAQRLEISLETLRVRVFRTRRSLEKCIQRCLERQRQ
jgi:RNA polymerase sigma factor (sigma-70 family)